MFAGDYEYRLMKPVPFASGVVNFSESIGQETFSWFVDLAFEKYPPGTSYNPVFEASLVKPVKTRKIRVVINDQPAHITEIRVFGPETTDYPPALSGKTAGVEAPNHATGATITASSEDKSRPKEGVIDGLMTFLSRWYAPAKKPPHWLEIDMGTDKVVNHIQMVTGYLAQGSAVWNAIAKDFHFEYWQDGQWEKIQFTESLVQEAGSFALKIENEQGQNILFLHDNDSAQRFAIGTIKDDEIAITKRHAPENIDEPQKGVDVRVDLKKVGDTIHFFCNGRRVVTYTIPIRGPFRVSTLSITKDTVYSVKRAGILNAEDDIENYLSDIIVRDTKNDKTIATDFDPFTKEIHAVLPNITHEVSIELEHAKSQRVFINNQQTDKLRLSQAQMEQTDPIAIRVVSENQHERQYTLEIVPVPPRGRLRLAFADEFEGRELNRNDWIYRRGLRWQSLNTPEAVSIKDGKLRIELSVIDGQQRVGGIISKKVYGYGYYETRAKLTDARGWHSAFWLYGLHENMPEKGSQSLETNGVYTEIDCFESTTGNAFSTNLHHTIHGLKGKDKLHRANVVDEFHTYAWLWTPEEICYYFDEELIDRRILYPATRPQNVWLTCVAHPDAETEDLPKEILFEYFRYYELTKQSDKLPDNAIIVATDSSGYVENGSWESAAADKAQSYQLETTTRKTMTQGSSCQWSATLPKSRCYEVLVWNPYIVLDPIINERKYGIQTADGMKAAYYNPRIAGQTWVSLGTYAFNQKASVMLKAESDELYRSDALAFVPLHQNN